VNKTRYTRLGFVNVVSHRCIGNWSTGAFESASAASGDLG